LGLTGHEDVALLAGGTGGGKLAAGLQDVVGDRLTAIVNTGDDVVMHGLYVSVDPDLVTYWLADAIDQERGWGLKDDRFAVHERLVKLGSPGWFGLSDLDLATSIYRTEFMAEAGTLTAAQAQVARALGVEATVLPMCEEPVRTFVTTEKGRRGLQEFLILDEGEGPIRSVELEGIESAIPTPAVLDAIAGADVIVVGPSNPVISIGPLLALGGLRDAVVASDAPVVAVSPLVAGHSVKGPTEAFVEALGRPVNAAGVASLYAGVIDGMVVDADDPGPDPEGIATVRVPTLMNGASGRRALAERVLEFAASLG
jgi:LPPG:FO 2-phospho-L-lactate transferase